MKRIDLKKILRMDFLIQHHCTGSPLEFAQKMEISRSTLFEYLTYMRCEFGVCILYNKFQRTYHYDGENIYSAIERMR